MVDWQLTDTYFVVAHFHYVLFGGAFMSILGAAYYWFPKMTGRMMDERLGFWNWLLIFVGFNLTFFPMHILGLDGMPRRIATYGAGLGWDFWNFVSTVGADHEPPPALGCEAQSCLDARRSENPPCEG